MTRFRLKTTLTRAKRLLRNRLLVATAIVLTLALPTVPAAAAPVHPGGPGGATETRPATARIFDIENNVIVFVNKSRADLCTPERLAYEAAFFDWLNSDQTTEPPVEPAASSQGVKPVWFTSRTGQLDARTTYGPDLPVEVWRQETDADGIDCLATDGDGAGLFATGTMTWSATNRSTPQLTSNDLSITGDIAGVNGQRYAYRVQYAFRQVAGQDGRFTPTIVLRPIH